VADQPAQPRQSQPLSEPPPAPASVPAPAGAGEIAASPLALHLRAILASPAYRPPLLPTVALEIHDLSHRPDVDADQLVALLEQDAVLAAQVLRVAGSPAYGGWSTSDPSLKQAVVRLGLHNLASVVWEVAMTMRVFRSVHYAEIMEEIRLHSTVCAYLCRLLASRKGMATESAFMCGLLHDIGMAATLLVMAGRPREEPPIAAAVLDEIFLEIHQEVSGMVARLWKLPAEVCTVLAHHHEGDVDGQANELVAVVSICEELSRDLGYGISIGPGRCDHVTTEALGRAFHTLGMQEDAWRELSSTARRVVDTVVPDLSPGKQPSPTPPSSTSTTGAPPAGRRATESRARQARRSWWSRLRRALHL